MPKEFDLGPNHVPGIRVPKGGSSCASCKFLKDREKGLCGNQGFIDWNGSDKIPAPIDSYCSDWYEPNAEAARKIRLQKMTETKEYGR